MPPNPLLRLGILGAFEMPNTFARTAATLKALAEPTRLRIVERLQREGSVTVKKLSQEMGTPIASVSHHLSLLREAGLVTSTKRGKFVTYSLNPEVVRGGKLRIGCCEVAIAADSSPIKS